MIGLVAVNLAFRAGRWTASFQTVVHPERTAFAGVRMLAVGRGTSPHAGRVLVALFALHRAELLRSPENVHAPGGTLVRVCSDGGAEALAITARVAGTRVRDATLVEGQYVHFTVARFEKWLLENCAFG